MKRYFFHVQDGRFAPDREGGEFETIVDARRRAIEICTTILQGENERDETGVEWQITVTDETDAIVYTLNFAGSDGPTLTQ